MRKILQALLTLLLYCETGALNLFNKTSRLIGNVFTKTLAIGDFWYTAGETASGKISVKAGSWVRVGQLTIGAQQLAHWGFGRADLPYNQGYLYATFYDDTGTPVALPGRVRLFQESAQGGTKLLVADKRTEELAPSVITKEGMIAFPEQIQFLYVGQDSKLVLEFLADSATAVNLTKANCTWRFPVTMVQ